MNNYPTKRFVFWQDGFDPVLNLSDLLYYDHVIIPNSLMMSTMLYYVDTSIPPNYAKNMDRLQESKLIIGYGQTTFLTPPDWEEYRSKLKSGIERVISPTQENYMDFLRQEFFIANTYRDAARNCYKKGFNIALKRTPKDFSTTFKKGNNSVLSILFQNLPVIPTRYYVDYEKINIDYLIDFVTDDETIIKRRRLFSWQNEVEAMIKSGGMKINHIPDLIATRLDDYNQWLKKSDLLLKNEMREFLTTAILGTLSIVGLPLALDKYFKFKAKKLELMDDENAPGRELAYIVHAQRALSEESLKKANSPPQRIKRWMNKTNKKK